MDIGSQSIILVWILCQLFECVDLQLLEYTPAHGVKRFTLFA